MSRINNLPVIERLTRSKIQIQMKNPFFSYMSLYLKFIHDESVGTAGVDDKGNFYYSEKFFENLSDKEIEGTTIHEILHLVLLSATRCGSRNHEIFNVATDLCINLILRENGFELPEGVLLPDSYGNFERTENGITISIKDIPNKTAEEIYDELEKQLPKRDGKGKGKGKEGSGEGEGMCSDGDIRDMKFDKHFYKEGLTEKEKKAIEKEWNDRVGESMAMARMRGKMPVGMERIIEKLHEEKINWRALLNEYITRQIPYNYCYSKPAKRSVSVGEYMPHQLKEKIEIAVCIDLSGSIGEKEYADFLSEIIGIARAYQERIDIHFYSHDTEGYYGGLVRNGNIEKIKNLKLKGCGGTSHKSVMEMMGKDLRDCKMVVFFTDGYSDLDEIDFNKYQYSKVFVIQNGDDRQLKGKNCKIIKMEKDRR